MTTSFTLSESTTFTVTHARHMAAKVSADLKRMQRFYGSPSDISIAEFEEEAVELLKAGYFGTHTLGFRRNGSWIPPTVRYTARDLAGAAANDDDPGNVKPGADIAGATFYSYLTYSAAWNGLTQQQRDTFQQRIPFSRSTAPQPTINGYLVEDRVYSAGGRAMTRSSVRSF